MNMRLKCNNGFVLVSYVVYATVLALLMAVSARLAVVIIPQAYALIAWCGHTDFYVAYDVLYKDLCCAPVHAQNWYKADEEGLIWHTQQNDHGWIIMQKNLLYKEGTYNPNTDEWLNVTSSVIAQNVQMETVILAIQGSMVQEVLCNMYKTDTPNHTWRCRKVFNGAAI
jgi:hypothetical protein